MTRSCWSLWMCIINLLVGSKRAKACSYSLLKDNHSLTRWSLCNVALVCLLLLSALADIKPQNFHVVSDLRTAHTNMICSWPSTGRCFLWQVWLACLNASWQKGSLRAETVMPLLSFFQQQSLRQCSFHFASSDLVQVNVTNLPMCKPLQMSSPHHKRFSREHGMSNHSSFRWSVLYKHAGLKTGQFREKRALWINWKKDLQF